MIKEIIVGFTSGFFGLMVSLFVHENPIVEKIYKKYKKTYKQEETPTYIAKKFLMYVLVGFMSSIIYYLSKNNIVGNTPAKAGLIGLIIISLKDIPTYINKRITTKTPNNILFTEMANEMIVSLIMGIIVVGLMN